MMKERKGQSTIEYALLVIIVMGALIATGDYFKRGIQGRWRSAVDDLGDQYDPRYANTSINYFTCSTSDTQVSTINANGGFWTMRKDGSVTSDSKKGYMSVDSY